MSKDKSNTTNHPNIVSREEWLAAREQLLVKEKAHTRTGAELSSERRQLPMMQMDPLMVEGANGEVPLEEVFEGRTTLIVYHFMWHKGAPHHKQCEGCTHFLTALSREVRDYLSQRDVTFAVFSSGALNETSAYCNFMGWDVAWYSTANSGTALATRDGGDLRCYLRAEGKVFQTYETKWRGVEAMMPSLKLLDLTPYGRQETWENSPSGYPQDKPSSWWRRDGRPVAQWTHTDEPVE